MFFFQKTRFQNFRRARNFYLLDVERFPDGPRTSDNSFKGQKIEFTFLKISIFFEIFRFLIFRKEVLLKLKNVSFVQKRLVLILSDF